MGSTLGSVLQGIGQTGDEAAAGQISGQQLQHQFTMDYLARQNQQRQLDLEQSGQANTLKLGLGAQDIERQRLEQSRWQLLPGYQRIPNPTDPTKYAYRYTHVDPITQQQVHTDVNDPPPGSPEAMMNNYKILKGMVPKGMNVSDGELFSIAANGKMDTQQDKNQKLIDTYNLMLKDPDGPKYLRKAYPGGLAEFVDKNNDPALSTKEMQLQWLRDNPGRTLTGQSVVNQADKAALTTYSQSMTHYTSILNAAMKDVETYGTAGKLFNKTAVDDAKAKATDAYQQIQRIQQNMQQLSDRMTGITQPTDNQVNPSSTPAAPNFTNPPVTNPKDIRAFAMGLTHKVTDKNGTLLGYSVPGAKTYTTLSEIP